MPLPPKSSPGFFCLVGAVVFHGLLVWLSFRWLPESVATHFDGSGNANGWMPRPQHLSMIAVVAVGVPCLVSLLVRLGRFFPPRFLNVPNAKYWRLPENHPTACTRAADWGDGFAAMLSVWGSVLHMEILLANLEVPPFFPPSSATRLGVMLFSGVIFSIALLLKTFQKPREQAASAAGDLPVEVRSGGREGEKL